MCCSIFAGVCLIQNLGLINDFVALLTAEMSNDEKISEFKKIFLKEIYWGIGTFFLEWIMGFSFEYVSYKVMIRIKISYLRILFSMDKIWFDNLDKTINELISDVEREISIIYSSLGIEVANILKLLTTIIYCIVKGFQINAITTLIKFVFLIAFIACIIILVIIMIKESNKKKKAYDIQGAYLSSIIKNIKGIVGFGNFDYEEKLFKEEIEKSNKIFKSYNWKTSLTNAFEDFIMDFSMATNNALIGHYIYENLVNEKNYNIDNIFTAAGAMDGLGQYFGELIPNTRQLVKCIDISKFYLNLKQYYLEKYNLDDEKNDLIFKEIEIEDEKSQDINDIQGKISFKNVKFSYCKENTSLMDINYILKDFNVDFEAKKITVISGESGSGKSTIINLIEKIYDVDEGQILIDDKYVLNDILSKEVKNKTHNIPFSLEDYRNIIGYVPQEPILCNDTIRTNILYGRNGISDEKIWEVLKKVNLYGFVKRLDNKLDYLVGNKGSKLSGGQKQRICIARALVNDPKILILDEATSSLDKINENQILELLEGLRDKVSIIFITHKPDILTIADQILYVKKGGLYEVKNQNVNEKKNKVQVIEHEMDYFDEEKIEINQNQKKNEKTSSVIDFILSMGSYKYLFFLAVFLSAAKGGISDVIFFYYSDCLGSYYEQTEGEKLKKEIVIYTIKPTIFSILAFICGLEKNYHQNIN